jgi:hypothetical protein
MHQHMTKTITCLASVFLLGVLGCDDSISPNVGPSVGTALFGAPGSWTYGETVPWTDFNLDDVRGIALTQEEAGGGTVELDREVVSLEESGAYEMIAYLDAAVLPALLLSTAWDGGSVEPTAGDGGLRLYNVSNASVDVSLLQPVIGTSLDIGEISAFVPVTYGSSGTNFYLMSTRWGFSRLAAIDEPAATSADVLVLTDPSPSAGDPPAYTEWYPQDIPADLETGAAVRVINASDTYATIEVEVPDNAIVGDLPFASATSWSVVSLPTEPLTIHVLIKWDLGAGSLLTTLPNTYRGDVITLVAYDNPSGGLLVLELRGIGDSGPGDVRLRVANVSATTSVTYGIENDAAVTSSLAHAESSPASDGAQDLQPGQYACTVRAAGAPASAAPAALGSWFTVADQDIATVVIHQDLAGDTSIIENIDPVPTLTPAASGQATIRLIHAADGTADLSGYTLE